MSERLRRLERVYERHPIYFVTACVVDRRRILDNPAIHDGFLHFSHAASQHGAWVGRYVLMPDHIHLFVALDERLTSLARWMKSLKNSLSKSLRPLGQAAPHWQKGFFDHVMRGGESYSQKWDYVRENPVRAGLVFRAEDWPYAGEIHELEYRRDLLL